MKWSIGRNAGLSSALMAAAGCKFSKEYNCGNWTAQLLQAIPGASQSMVSMILSGQRELSKKTIAKLADDFKLDPGYFF